jgi:hypothetical protein
VTAVLLANAAATLFMTGLTWFVQVVHYPLFDSIGEREFPEYHRLHSSRTTWVVLPAMAIELITSFALLFDPPGDASGLVMAGAALAASTWVLTAFAAAAHGSIGKEGPGARSFARLLKAGWIRTAAWTAHGIVVIGLLAAVIEPGT